MPDEVQRADVMVFAQSFILVGGQASNIPSLRREPRSVGGGESTARRRRVWGSRGIGQDHEPLPQALLMTDSPIKSSCSTRLSISLRNLQKFVFQPEVTYGAASCIKRHQSRSWLCWSVSLSISFRVLIQGQTSCSGNTETTERIEFLVFQIAGRHRHAFGGRALES